MVTTQYSAHLSVWVGALLLYDNKRDYQLFMRTPTDYRLSRSIPDEHEKRSYISATPYFSSDSRGIQTHNLLIRSQMLYSVELGSLIAYLRVQK